MDKDESTIKVEQLADNTKQLPVPIELFGAPQPSLSTPDNNTIATGSGGNYVASTAATTIANMRTRINEIEGVLIRAGIIKGTYGG